MNEIDVLIPTYDNERQLKMAINSIYQSVMNDVVWVTIINNHQEKEVGLSGVAGIVTKVANPKMNLGWEGGLAIGLQLTKSDLVVFSNDDILVPLSSRDLLTEMAKEFDDKTVGAVGPSSNCVMGYQSIFGPPLDVARFDVPFLIGFFVMVRRSALEQCGGVDTKLPGGDDIDLSVRLRQAGYRLVCRKDLFVYHHGFQTGVRLHGDHTKPFGWNSPEMTDRTWKALHAKHGDAAIDELKLPLEEFWKLSEKEPVWR